MTAAIAIEGPNGIGVFRPFFAIRKEIIPKTVPIIDAKNNVSNVFTVPNTRPITKNNLISPPPIPPFDTSAMKNNRPNPTTAPTKLSHQGVRGEKNRLAIIGIKRIIESYQV